MYVDCHSNIKMTMHSMQGSSNFPLSHLFVLHGFILWVLEVEV